MQSRSKIFIAQVFNFTKLYYLTYENVLSLQQQQLEMLAVVRVLHTLGTFFLFHKQEKGRGGMQKIKKTENSKEILERTKSKKWEN